ncbi:hypothetical protein GCM10028819_49650 [Spirosoma humi]
MADTKFELNIKDASLKPVYRRLRGYAFDPSFANRLDLFGINTIVYPIYWEELKPGPIGEYVEVVDIDPASGVFYPPVDLNDPQLMVQDGLPPSESNPQFHQQMVYAVAMTTIQNFEKALGRPIQWSSSDYDTQHGKSEGFVQRLRLYPHALREANAYYSSDKKAVLFGYFSARPTDESILMPGSLVFTCLSHDIISHEVTHALIDGIYKGYVFPVHEDTLALHEAFSDLVALFQHFTFPDVLENQIAKTRGELRGQQLLSELAQQFGLAVGNYGALRDAIGQVNDKGEWESIKPDPSLLRSQLEPHARGSILVASIFEAFLNIYQKRTFDLYRIATDGTGVLPAGDIRSDLVKRLATEASRTAKQFLSLCIRALDYCPPIGTSFGEFLRALITADVDLVPDDQLGYRIALIEAFKRRGIYPASIRTLSVENLTYYAYTRQDIIGSSRDETKESDAETESKATSSLTSLFQKIDDLILEAEYLPYDARVVAPFAKKLSDQALESKKSANEQKNKANRQKDELMKIAQDYMFNITTQLDSLKNAMTSYLQDQQKKGKGSSKDADLVSTYQGDIKVHGADYSTKKLESTLNVRNTKQKEIDLFLTQFWYLAQHFYNETAGFLTKTDVQADNRKRLFLISQDYRRRLHYLFTNAHPETRDRLQDLTGILFRKKDYPTLCTGQQVARQLLQEQYALTILDVYQPNLKENFEKGHVSFEVHTLHRAQRVGPDTNVINHVVLTLMQRFQVSVRDERANRQLPDYQFSGGCTLVIDIDKKTIRIIRKGILDAQGQGINLDTQRLVSELRRRFRPDIANSASPFAPSRWPSGKGFEPFARLHQGESS